VDSLGAGAPISSIWRYAGLLVVVAVVSGFFQFSQRQLLVSVSRHLEHRLRTDLYDHLLRLPSSFYMRERVGDLLTRAVSDVGAVRMAVGPALMYAINTLTILVVSSVLMARINLPLALLSLAALPLVAGVTRFFGSRIHLRWGQSKRRCRTTPLGFKNIWSDCGCSGHTAARRRRSTRCRPQPRLRRRRRKAHPNLRDLPTSASGTDRPHVRRRPRSRWHEGPERDDHARPVR